MKNQNLLPELTQKLVLLHFAIDDFFNLFEISLLQKSGFIQSIAISLHFYCICHCNALHFFIRSELHKIGKKMRFTVFNSAVFL